MTTSLPHANLVLHAQTGDPAALSRLLAVCAADARRYARRHCHASDVDDAVQESLLIVSRKIKGLKAAVAFSSWLFVVIRRECRRLERLLTRHEAIDDEDAAMEAHLAQRGDAALRIDLARALESLPAHYLEVVLLRDFEESASDVLWEADRDGRVHTGSTRLTEMFGLPEALLVSSPLPVLLEELAPQPPSVSEPRTGLSMGQHCELMAKEWHISREDQDKLAQESHTKARDAYRSGYMDDLVVPCAGVFRDNNIREDVSLEKLASLRTAFDKSPAGTLTAANSTPLTDGAAAVLLASEEWAARHGLPVLAYLTVGQSAANNFVAGEGLLMAPTIAVSKMLDRAGLKLQDFDFYEIHEAFAAQVLATLKAWEDPDYCKRFLGKDQPLGSIDRARLNVKGSSIAVGHPFAATGARIVANLAKLLSEHGGRGLVSVCTAGGMGVAAIMESAKAGAMRAAAE
jgi:acetyl-CoA acetyltransferase family protein